ncbi:capsular exopolysaccharide family [Chthoniobacter flavus Ellin428]|uniref:Capsular exopolysaccharide family n=1 Tax=Chthoniobacter flavus Ellin428 TaxID=497964 RepID=B4CZV9_9BACT|nr:polysaccharide biosynthesis tyrosine autokinase [Chthoniobacter flavus]EDY20273.1 capsular exopolysaccharide family [Chthoniobacter flavus Ellin428]TCO94170.1 capsular exopolysaccharide synthesis family protein [Chthoniobacter flavus]
MIPGTKKPAFTLHDIFLYVAIASKHARLMVLLICFALTAGLTYYVFAKPVYYAHALIHLEYLARPLDTDKLYEDGRLSAFVAQFTEPQIMLRTARALGIDTNSRDLERKYLFKFRASLNTEKNIDVEAWPYSADWAHRWTETMVQQFIAYRQERRNEEKNLIVNTYSEELKELVGRLDQQFSEKLDFQDQQDFTKTLILVNSINNLPADLTKLQMRIDEIGRVRVRLQDPALDSVAKLSLIASADDNDTRLSVGQTVAQPQSGQSADKKDAAANNSVVVVPSLLKSLHPWDELAQQQQQVKKEISEGLRKYLPTAGAMKPLYQQLDVINQRLDAEVEVATNRFNLEYQELLNKKHDLEAKLPEYQELSRKHAKLLSQLSIFDASRVPYDTYLANMQREINEVEFAGEKERINLKYSGLLEVRDDPVSPNRLRIMLLSFVGGLVLALGIPFLIEYLDHTMTNLEEVEHSFRLRGLGVVPQTEATDMFLPATAVASDDTTKHGLVENFRVIRTNILSMGELSKPPHVVMVTSAMPKEGKTVVSSNLAASFALTGAKTLLIDTDLRRGRLHRLFGYRKEPGLSNVLLGECTLEDAFRPSGQENLTVLSAGRHLDHGTELLGSAQFSELLNSLRGRFDRIVIDTPPVLGLSETSIMQSLVDGVLFVIWTGQTPVRCVKSAIETLRANRANFYGFVLNRLDLNATQNYYQYYYYSHDYYYQHAIEST